MIAVDRLGSVIEVSAIFPKIPRPVSRSELELRSGPHVVGRLGLGVWVSASFQIFALTAGGGDVLGGGGNCPGGGMFGEICPRKKCPV